MASSGALQNSQECDLRSQAPSKCDGQFRHSQLRIIFRTNVTEKKKTRRVSPKWTTKVQITQRVAKSSGNARPNRKHLEQSEGALCHRVPAFHPIQRTHSGY